jgi:hypothetical protein
VSAADISVGYPVHAVAEFRQWENQHGVHFTDWKAACGATGTATGRTSTAFGLSGSARKRELCRACWPAGHATFHQRPRDLVEEDQRVMRECTHGADCSVHPDANSVHNFDPEQGPHQ